MHPALGCQGPPQLPTFAAGAGLPLPCKLRGDCLRNYSASVLGWVFFVGFFFCRRVFISRCLLQCLPGQKKKKTPPKNKQLSPTPLSVSALDSQQRCRNTCLPPSAGKGLCDCRQYNYKAPGLRPPLAAARVDFGLCLHFNRPSPLEGETCAGENRGAAPRVVLPAAAPQNEGHVPWEKRGEMLELGDAASKPPSLLSQPFPSDAGEGNPGCLRPWGVGGVALRTLQPRRNEAVAGRTAEPTP